MSNISRRSIGNKIVYHSDIVGASPVGATTTIYSFSTKHLASIDWAKTSTRRDEKHLSVGIGAYYIRGLKVMQMLTYLCQRRVSEETHPFDRQECVWGTGMDWWKIYNPID